MDEDPNAAPGPPDPAAEVPTEISPSPSWLSATSTDYETVTLEAPIHGSTAVETHQLQDLYETANRAAVEANDGAAARVYATFAALCSFYPKPNDPAEPFGPLMVANGHRTAIVSDFRGAPGRHLSAIVDRLSHPVLVARVADTCWQLDRSRSAAAAAAVNAYCDTVAQSREGRLRRWHDDAPINEVQSASLLRRALQIGRALGPDKAPTQRARAMVSASRVSALEQKSGVALRVWSALDLDLGISEPIAVAENIEAAIPGLPAPIDAHLLNALWKLASRGFHVGKQTDRRNRCLAEAAECFVRQAEARSDSAMAASHFLTSAIEGYRNLPNQTERRAQLREMLLATQKRIVDEMNVVTYEMDIGELIEDTRSQFTDGSVTEKLRRLALIAKSPDLETLRISAIESIRQSPLSSMIPASRLDSEGKPVHRSAGGHDDQEAAIDRQMFDSAGIERGLVAASKINVARYAIMEQHHVGPENFAVICQNSPLVPADRSATFALGFARFLQGDMVSALYILTPQLENSIRHLLKYCGHDVVKIDDADSTQEDRSISALLSQFPAELEAIFGKNIVADIDRVFLEKRGPSIRHKVAHGLLSDGAPYGDDAAYACWLIFRLVCLPLTRHWQQVEGVQEPLLE